MGVENYTIKYSSMDDFQMVLSQRVSTWFEQLETWEISYNDLIGMEQFQGVAATSAKLYLEEMHSVLLSYIRVALTRLSAEFLLYKDGYYSIDENIYAVLSQENILDVKKRMKTEGEQLIQISEAVNSSLGSVSDILFLFNPPKYTLQEYFDGIYDSLVTFNDNIETYESDQCTIAKGDVKDIVNSLEVLMRNYASNGLSLTTYKSGEIAQVSGFYDMYQKSVQSCEYLSNNESKIAEVSEHQEAIYEQMQEDYEAACAARKDEGTAQMIIGGAAIIAGTVAIVMTAGAAAPIVVTACVSGGGAILYGASEVTEGGQEYYYGSVGDLSSISLNPLRDTVFMGNQNAYDFFGAASLTVAGLCVPVSKAVNGVAGMSSYTVAKAAATTIVKETIEDKAIDLVSNKATNYATDKMNLNQTQSTLLNMGINQMISKGYEKGGDAIKSRINGGVDTTPFTDGMNYDEAQRYNLYWEEIEAGTHNNFPGLNDADIHNWNLANEHVEMNRAMSMVDTDELLALRRQELFGTELKMSGEYDSGVVYESIIQQNGLTIDEFTNLKIKDVQLLTPAEVTKMKAIRESIPMPTSDTPMQKIIHMDEIDNYLSGEYNTVGGFISKAEDVSTFKNYDDIVDNLRLDYSIKNNEGISITPFINDSNDYLGQIRFQTLQAEKIEIPFGSNGEFDSKPLGGTEYADIPFTGNGFTKSLNDNVIPEYKIPKGEYLSIDDGAEIYKIYRDGTEELVAIYDGIDEHKFISVK